MPCLEANIWNGFICDMREQEAETALLKEELVLDKSGPRAFKDFAIIILKEIDTMAILEIV